MKKIIQKKTKKTAKRPGKVKKSLLKILVPAKKTKKTAVKSKTKKTALQKKQKKIVVGLVEDVVVIGSKGKLKTKALFDTGATRSSIDLKIAAKTGLGPIVGTVNLKTKTTSNGSVQRPIVIAKLKILGKTFNEKVNLADRKNMPYPVLVGRTIIHNNFIVDLSKTHKGYQIFSIRKNKK